MIEIFFFIVFFLAFGRFVVELFSTFRNVFLMKFSLLLMALSAAIYFLLLWIREKEIENNIFVQPDLTVGLLFFIGSLVCAGIGYVWLKRMK